MAVQSMTHVGKHKAHSLMKFDIDFVDDMWYDYANHHCIVLYNSTYTAYHCDCDSGEETTHNSYEEAMEHLYNHPIEAFISAVQQVEFRPSPDHDGCVVFEAIEEAYNRLDDSNKKLLQALTNSQCFHEDLTLMLNKLA